MMRFIKFLVSLFVFAALSLASVAMAGGEDCAGCPRLTAGVEVTNDQLAAELQAIRARLNRLPGSAKSSDLAALREQVEELAARLAALENRVTGHDEAIAELRLQISELTLRVDELEHRVTDLEESDRRQNIRLDALEARDGYLPLGFVVAGGASVRRPIVAGDGRPLTGSALGFAGAGIELRFGGAQAGDVYVGGTGLGFFEGQKSYGFRATGNVGYLPSKAIELGAVFGGEGHYIQGLDPRISGHVAYAAGGILGPHLGFILGGEGEGLAKVNLDVPIMFGQAKTATSSSDGVWVEVSPTVSLSVFLGNAKDSE